MISELLNTLNYIVQGFILYDFVCRYLKRGENCRKGMIQYILLSIQFSVIDYLIRPLPAGVEIIVKTLVHQTELFLFYRHYFKKTEISELIMMMVIMISLAALSEITAVEVLGCFIPLQAETVDMVAPHHLIVVWLFIDTVQFVLFRILLILKSRKMPGTDIRAQLVIALYMLYYLLVFGQLSVFITADQISLTPLFKIAVLILFMLSNGALLVFLRYVYSLNAAIKSGNYYTSFNLDIGRQDIYLDGTERELCRLQNRILAYRSAFPANSTADSIYDEFHQYIENRFSRNLILDSLIRYYDSDYSERKIIHAFRMNFRPEKYLDDYTTVTLFSYLLDYFSGFDRVTLESDERLDLLKIRIMGHSGPRVSAKFINTVKGFLPGRDVIVKRIKAAGGIRGIEINVGAIE